MRYIIIAGIAWLCAQGYKTLRAWVKQKSFPKEVIFSSGGMPSAHSAFISALAVTIGEVEGWNSTMFALAFVFASIVVYDSIGVRRSVGLQAQIINRMIETNEIRSGEHLDKTKEVMGHTPSEAFVGVALGVVVGLVFSKILL